jgi:myo-inositol-1(or 4)-monophosphatase
VFGKPDSEYRWVIDPLDGTVNYTYSIPHFSVSIACQKRNTRPAADKSKFNATPGWTTIVGVIYDPMRNEMFCASEKTPARLNGKPIRVSSRTKLEDAVVSVGFFKTTEVIDRSLPHFQRLVHRARKVRIMGSAALDLAYVACGRYDAYLEYGIKLWDIAAGLLLLEKARGSCELRLDRQLHTYDIFAGGNIKRSTVLKSF